MPRTSKRILEARSQQQAFLARFNDMRQRFPSMTEEEFFLWENADEEHFIELIKKFLRTASQRAMLEAMDLTIADLLNGRFNGEQEKSVLEIFADWNSKLGKDHFKF